MIIFWVNISVGVYGSAWDCFMIFIETEKEVDVPFGVQWGKSWYLTYYGTDSE